MQAAAEAEAEAAAAEAEERKKKEVDPAKCKVTPLHMNVLPQPHSPSSSGMVSHLITFSQVLSHNCNSTHVSTQVYGN